MLIERITGRAGKFGELAKRDVVTTGDLPDGTVVQVVNTQDGAVATGVTISPDDDTIPQNTEGDEYITLAITPKATTNILVIEVLVNVSHDNQNVFTIALFQDATAGALAAIQGRPNASGILWPGVLRHKMTAGTISSTTFKIRVGNAIDGSTTTFNGSTAARKMGGVMASSITITEIKA